MLARVVTGDESWVHHYQPETKHASVQWKHPVSPSPPPPKKIWDHKGILLTAFQPQGQTVNADFYCNILRKLHKGILRKWPGLTRWGKSLPGSKSSPKNFMLLVFRGLWNDGTSASVYR
jgi:hypothetical protein